MSHRDRLKWVVNALSGLFSGGLLCNELALERNFVSMAA